MSHQPSTLDNIRATASSTTHYVADTIDPSNQETENRQQNDQNPAASNETHLTKENLGHVDAQSQPCSKGNYKDQLNDAAVDGGSNIKKETTMLEKVKAYIPGVGVSDSRDDSTGEIIDDGNPPSRPDHDVQVEEFLRNQYHSKKGKE